MAVSSVERTALLQLTTSLAPPARSLDVEARLHKRRSRVVVVKRRLALCDAAGGGALSAAALALGHLAGALAALAVTAIVVAHVGGADGPRTAVRLRTITKAVVAVVATGCFAIAVLGTRQAGGEVLVGALVVAVALAAGRALLHLPALAKGFGLQIRPRLVVGDPDALERMATSPPPAAESGQPIMVATRAERPAEALGESEGSQNKRQEREERDGPCGLVERIVRTALDESVERVTVIPGASWQRRQLRELSWLLDGTAIDMVIATDLDGIAPHRVGLGQQDGRLTIQIGSGSPRGTQAFVKQVLDRLAAAVLLVVLSPLLAIIALAVRLDSTGPAIFCQRRVREAGATFPMYKFRTMCIDAEQKLDELRSLNKHDADGLFKMDDDPRITRVGRVLRRTSLDELPQLVNVLRGEMSLIGPRPALPSEVATYDYVARRRLAVKPGLTGLWQVSGRSRLGWDESIGLDLDYVDNWSYGTDAVIAVRTLRAVVTRDGAV